MRGLLAKSTGGARMSISLAVAVLALDALRHSSVLAKAEPGTDGRVLAFP